MESTKTETFTNAKGEPFCLHVFRPAGDISHGTTDTDANAAECPPVLFCVHGAGMSGDNFTRLAAYLQRGEKGAQLPSVDGNGTADLMTTACLPGSNEAFPSASTDGAVRPPLPPPPHPLHGGRSGPSGPLPARIPGPAGDTAFMPPLDSPVEPMPIAVVTYDLRCHGDSTYAGGEESLTLNVLVDDFVDVLTYAKTTLFPSSPFYVLGHSLGGSIVAQGLSQKAAQDHVSGVILVDVVEGTAKVSLKYMHDFLKKRPTAFDNVKEAERWFLQHGGMRTPEGAAVSVPPLLKVDGASGKFVWKSDLSRMESVWDGWFDGLDKTFVNLPFSKMLCLANAERLDTELTIAQMQGKFQFEIVGNECGHYVMDDATSVLGSKIFRFMHRIETLTKKLKRGIKPGMPLHMNNTTVPRHRA